MLLGKKSTFPKNYDPELIEVISREAARLEINYNPSHYNGLDLWTIYEFSHINENNIPHNAILSLAIPQESTAIPESKSLKLYFNSLNQLKKNFNDALKCVVDDTSKALSCKIDIKPVYKDKNDFKNYVKNHFINLDSLKQIDLKFKTWTKIKRKRNTTQYFYSSLFKSNCPVTNQPDWASLFLAVESEFEVNANELLSYIISFRDHQAFHEQCIEEIIETLRTEFSCKKISVLGRFTRRGGIDINPYRYFAEEDELFKEIIEKSKILHFWDPRQ